MIKTTRDLPYPNFKTSLCDYCDKDLSKVDIEYHIAHNHETFGLARERRTLINFHRYTMNFVAMMKEIYPEEFDHINEALQNLDER